MNFNRLYIHIPFCASKCGYCAFYSEAEPSTELISSFMAKLENEFSANFAKCSELDSVFIGGGTPTYLSSANLAKLFEMISANFAISDNAEISIEANPESLDEEKVKIIADFANRVSIGIQSFNCEFRKILGRKGNSDSVKKGIEFVKSSGIENIGCDLIYAIPGQKLSDWENELKKAVDLGVKHISAYSLTYEDGTRLAENQLSENQNMELEAEMWEFAGEYLKSSGIPRYEVSNYSVPGFECRHNLEIWYGDTYLGCGPAATSFDGKDRYSNPSDINEWINGKETEKDIISPEKRAAEILIMGLRTSQGWDIGKFEKRTGLSKDLWLKELKKAECEGFVRLSNEKVVPTEKGLIFWDILAESII